MKQIGFDSVVSDFVVGFELLSTDNEQQNGVCLVFVGFERTIGTM